MEDCLKYSMWDIFGGIFKHWSCGNRKSDLLFDVWLFLYYGNIGNMVKELSQGLSLNNSWFGLDRLNIFWNQKTYFLLLKKTQTMRKLFGIAEKPDKLQMWKRPQYAVRILWTLKQMCKCRNYALLTFYDFSRFYSCYLKLHYSD